MLNKDIFIFLIGFSLFSVAHSQCFYFQTTINNTVHYSRTKVVEANKDGAILEVVAYIQPSHEGVFQNEDERSCMTHSAISPILIEDQDFAPQKLRWIPIFISGVDVNKESVKLTYHVAIKERVDLRIFTNEMETFATATALRDPTITNIAHRGWHDEFRILNLFDSTTGEGIDVPNSSELVIRIDNNCEELWYLLKVKRDRVDYIDGIVVELGENTKWIFKTTIDGTIWYADVRKFCDKKHVPPRKYLKFGASKRAKNQPQYRNDSSDDAKLMYVQTSNMSNRAWLERMKDAAIALELVCAPSWAALEPQKTSWSPLSITDKESMSDGSVAIVYEEPREFPIEILVLLAGGNEQSSTTLFGKALLLGNREEKLATWIGQIIIKWNQPEKFTELTTMSSVLGEHSTNLLFLRERNDSEPGNWRRVLGIDAYVGQGSMVVIEYLTNQVVFWSWPEDKSFGAVRFQASIDELKRELSAHNPHVYRIFPAQTNQPKIILKEYLKNSKNKFAVTRHWSDECEGINCKFVQIDIKKITGTKQVSFSYAYVN